MIRRGLLAAALAAFALICAPLLMAQVNPGTSPLPGEKGGTGNAFMQFAGPSSPGVKTYTLPASTSTIAALNAIQTWTGAQSFTDGDLILLGSASSSAVLHAPSTSGGSVTFFTGNDTVAGIAATQTFTNKTIASSSNTLGAVIMGLGGDAAGDIYYNNGGFLTRLPKGSNGQVLELVTGLPAWQSVSGAGTVTTPGAGLVSSTTSACSQAANQSTLSAAECVNAQGGNNYAIQDSDRAKLLTASSSAALSYTIAQAGAASNFQGGWFTEIANLTPATSSGIVTLTPTTSTINGNSTLPLYPGERVKLVSDGTNYQASYITAVNGPWHLLNVVTVSNAASISDTTSITSAFTEYEIVLEGVFAFTSSQTLQLQVQANGSFQTSSYTSANLVGNGSTAGSGTNATGVAIGNGVTPTSGAGVFAKFLLSNPSNAGTNKFLFGNWVTSQPVVGDSGGAYTGGTQAVTGIRAIMASGNISGTMKIYGRVN